MAANGQAAAVPPLDAHTQQQMAAVLGQDLAAFESLIQGLMSPQNEVRTQAERLFQACKTHQADACMQRLVQVLQGSQVMDCRGLCAVLLRKALTTDAENETWKSLNAQTQLGIKTELLNLIKRETNRSTSKMICDTVSEVGAMLLEENQWPELLPFMFTCVQSGDERLLESVLRIFAQLVASIEMTLTPYLDTLHGVFAQCLTSQNNDVRNAALRATCSFISSIEKKQERDKFQDLVPSMLGCLGTALSSGDEATAQETLEMFIEIGEEHPTFLRKNLVDIVNAILTVTEADNLESGTRQLAAEFLVTLAEAREKAPGMMRKLPQFMGKLFHTLMLFLLDIDDEPEWHAADREEDEGIGNGELFDVGLEGLDRLAIALGGNSVMPIITQLLPAFLQDAADWKKRHAALMTLAQIAEGCVKVLTNHISWTVDICVAGLQDAHAKVRWSACQAVGQLSTDLGPDFQDQEHARLVPTLLAAMDDVNEARVQAHATAAVVNFSEDCEEELLAPYLDALVSKLLILLQSPRNIVREGALTSLASVADSSKEYFEKYYTVVMPILMNILTTANDKTLRTLRAKAIECVSLVGMAVGKDRFGGDAKHVMDIFMALQNAEMEDDDPTASYLLQAWARVCKCLGHDFLPYLQVVMPPLLQAARLEPDVSVKYLDDDDDDDEDQNEDVETLIIGDRKICIRTSTLEEKSTACSMLCCYAEELREGFYQYIDEIVQLFVPLLRFAFHEEVRSTVAGGLPELLQSAKCSVEKGCGKDSQWVKSIMDYILGPLLEATKKEVEAVIIVSQVQALGQIVSVCGEALDQNQVVLIFTELRNVLDASLERRKERESRRETEDFDEDEEEAIEEENEEEDEVSDATCDCIDELLKKFKSAVMPLVEQLLPYFAQMLEPNRSNTECRIAICLIDAVLESASENGATMKYFNSFVPVLLNHCTHEDAEIRQCAAYGLGICAKVYGEAFAPVCKDALAKLMQVIQSADARTSEYSDSTDNAVAALGKLAEYQSVHPAAGLDAHQLFQFWLSQLPLKSDKSEAKVVHDQFCKLLEAGDVRLLGKDNANLGVIMNVLAKTLSEGKSVISSDEVQAKLMSFLQKMVHSIPQNIVQQHLAQLDPKSQQIVHAALTPNGH